MTWSTACPDWAERITSGQSLVPFPPLYPQEAEEALATFKSLRLVDVAGSPTIGETCRPWLIDFAGAIFGAYDPKSGRRQVREFLLLVAKKNSKSTTAAAIMLTALLRNWRQSNEFLILAPTIEIANNAFRPTSDMVAADEELSTLLHIQAHTRTITHRNTGATLKVVAADNETVGGKKAAGVLVDELWLFGKQPNAENMLREATGGRFSRPEGFVIYLSTQSDEPPAGVFKQKLEYFRDVRDGKIIDNRSLGVLYEFPKPMIDAADYLDPANFGVANPNLGASVDAEELASELKKSQSAGPHSLAGFLAKHLNVQIGQSLRGDRWPGAEYWQSRAKPDITFEYVLKHSEVIVVGFDGGGLDDLSGLLVLGRDKQSKDWLAWGHAWCHASVLERRKSIASLLRDFERDGDLTIFQDDLSDIAEMVALIARVKEAGKLHCVSADPASIGELIDALADIGVVQDNKTMGRDFIVGAPQGIAMMNALKTAERKLANGTLWHAAQGLMAWAVGNLKIEAMATAIRATKQNAGDAKVDPAFALFDAVTVMSTNPPATASVYEERPLLVL